MEYIDYYKDSQLLYNHNLDYPPLFRNYGMHAHDIYELYYVISGEGTFTVEGTTYPLTSRSIYLIRSNEAHYTKLNNTTPYERICLHFYPGVLDLLDPEHTLLAPFESHELGENNFYPLDITQQTIVTNAFSDISRYSSEDSYHKRLSIMISLFTILEELNKIFQTEKHQSVDVQKNPRIGAILTYINSHLFEDITADELCDRFFLSRSQLYDTFKKCTHTTLGAYLLTKRMNAAKTMLKNRVPAKEVAYLCGYRDYSAFYRAYKKFFHMSPSAHLSPNNDG